MRVSLYCREGFERIDLPDPAASAEGEARCANGHAPVAYRHSEAVRAGERVDACSGCGSRAFYVQKDFDQRLGCAILLAGALIALAVGRAFGGIWFVPVLLGVAAVDLLLARRVKPVVICYRCDAEYRDVPDAQSHPPYDPHIAERDAEVKTVRRMT